MTVRSPGIRAVVKTDGANSGGDSGPRGPAGKDGASILAGEGPPTDDAGSTGDLYIDAESGDLYRKET